MATLPPEILIHVFKAIADSGLQNACEWWTPSDESLRALDTASLVCKLWKATVAQFRTTYALKGTSKYIKSTKWVGGFRRNGDRLSKTIKVAGLHIPWMVDALDTVHPESLIFNLPQSFPRILLEAEETLTSLSCQGELLFPDQLPLETYAVLERLLKKVERLHIYSDDTLRESFDGHYTSTGYSLPWRLLAKSVWENGRTAPLKQLALSRITVSGPKDMDEAFPCPAKVVALANVPFANIPFNQRPEYSGLFPSAECLIWQWTVIGRRARQHDDVLSLKSGRPSMALKHLQIIWDSDFSPSIMTSGLVKSPVLQTLWLQRIQQDPLLVDRKTRLISALRHRQVGPYDLIRHLPGLNMPNLQELRIDGSRFIGNLNKPGPEAILLEKLADPSFCPKLSRTPAQDQPDGCIALFLRKSRRRVTNRALAELRWDSGQI